MKFKLPGFHLSDRLRFQDGHAVDGSVLKKREHKTLHVHGRGAERTRGRGLHEFEIARFLSGGEVALRYLLRRCYWKRLIVCLVRHSQRLKNVIVDVTFESIDTNTLAHERGDVQSEIGIRR